MASQHPIAYIDIRTTAHATEDTDKVLKAIRNILPTELLETVNFTATNLTGHHKNPITLIETRIKDKITAEKTFTKIAAGLSMLDKETLNNQINQHIEKANLYLRLDKQDAYANELKLGQTDPIHLRIHFKNQNQNEIIETCRKLGLLP